MRFTPRLAGLALLLATIAVSGCAQLDEMMGGESVDYKSTVRGEPLTIPPDLTQANRNPQFKTPEGGTTLSQYTEGQRTHTSLVDADKVLPQQAGISVMRDGTLRWLSIDRPAQDVYPRIIDFWGEQGFTIFSQNPTTGLIETDWAENRKKIPESWLRNILKIVDQVFDSGERERFRTRLERVNGKTEVYISHEQMIETPSGDETTFRWVPGKEDPNLNAAMLARLMVFLGTDIDEARAKVTQAEQAGAAEQLVQPLDGQVALSLSEPFDRAWRRVGVAIDSAGFSLEDRDRSTGDYFIRYLDTDTGIKRDQENVFTRLFNKGSQAEAEQYRIHVAEQGGRSTVTVRNAQGQQDSSATAQRILSVLSTHLKGN